MKVILSFLFCFLIFSPFVNSQVGISDWSPTPANCSVLDLNPHYLGFLAPRMSLAERDAIIDPATGLLVYVTTTKCYQYYNGTTWIEMTTLEDNDWTFNDDVAYSNVSGNVGIGTSSPGAKLDVDGPIYIGSNNITNVFIGQGAGESATGSNYANICIGKDAGKSFNLPGNHSNIFIGVEAGKNSTSTRNTGIGYQVLYSNTTGTDNTASGHLALHSITTGSGNTALGSKANAWEYTGSNNTVVGTNAGVSFEPVSPGYNNSGGLGHGATITASNQIRIGNSSVTSIGGYASWSNVSDKNFKQIISEDIPGVKFINLLKPVTYCLDILKLNQFIHNHVPNNETNFKNEDASQKKSIIYSGLLAQDVQEIAESIHFDFCGIDLPKNENDYYSIRYADIVVPLVKAVQEQQDTISQLIKRIDFQNSKLEILKQRLNDKIAQQ